MRQRESLTCVAWGARRKPGPASPANMSKRGLFARHSVPNQTLSLVNTRLPKGNPVAGNRGGSAGYGNPAGFRGSLGGRSRPVASPIETAASRPPQLTSPVGWVERSDTHQLWCAWRWVSLRSTHPTIDTRSRSRGTICPRFASSFVPPRKQRAQGRPGARCTRGLVCEMRKQKRTRAYRFSGNTPAFPAQWLYGLLRALPGERLFCHRHRAGRESYAT